MAAGVGDAGGGARSFAAVLQASLAFEKVEIPVHEPEFTDKGDSACFFNKDEIQISLSPVRFTVVAKTPYGRPAFPDIRTHVQKRCELSGCFVISSIDQHHLLFRFALEDDFLRVLLRESLLVMGKLFKFFKWTPNFRSDVDPSAIPVWIDLPGLPINLYQDSFVRSIACNIGRVLQVAHDTVHLINTQAARVCIELDLQRPRKDRIWIGMGDAGYWQEVVYPKLPAYCSGCLTLGHHVDSCGNNKATKKQPPAAAPIPIPSGPVVQQKKTTSSSWQQVTRGKGKAPVVALAPSTSNSFQALIEVEDAGCSGTKEAVAPDLESPNIISTSPPPHEDLLEPTLDDLGNLARDVGISTALHGEGESGDVEAVRDATPISDRGEHVHGVAEPPRRVGSPGVRIAPESRPVLEEGETQVSLEPRKSVYDVANEGIMQVVEDAQFPVGGSHAAAKAGPSVSPDRSLAVRDGSPSSAGLEGGDAVTEGQNISKVDGSKNPIADEKLVNGSESAPPENVLTNSQCCVAGIRVAAGLEDGEITPLAPRNLAPVATLEKGSEQAVVSPEGSEGVNSMASLADTTLSRGLSTSILKEDNMGQVVDGRGVQGGGAMQESLFAKAVEKESTGASLTHVGSTEALQLIPRGKLTHTAEDIPLDAGDVPPKSIASPGQLNIHVASYKAVLQTPQATTDLVAKDVSSSSSGRRKIISQPSRKGGVRICLPATRVRSPSPPQLAANSQIQINMEAVRAVMEQSRAENIFMPGYTFPSGDSDDQDDDEDTFYDERCRRRPGLRPRGVLRRKHSYDDLSLEF